MRLSHDDQMRRARLTPPPIATVTQPRSIADYVLPQQRAWQLRSRGGMRGLLVLSRTLSQRKGTR